MKHGFLQDLIHIIGLIYADLPITAAITTEIPKNGEHHASETESDVLNIKAIKKKAHAEKGLFGNSFTKTKDFQEVK